MSIINIALFIGRFQPFHRGHLKVVKDIRKKYTPVIGIGSSEKMNSFDNPLSFNERRKMILNCLEGINIFPIPDRNDDSEWVEEIKEKIRFKVVITGNDWTRRCFKQEGIPVKEQHFYSRDKYKGTRIRNLASEGNDEWKRLVPKCSRDLLEKFNFAERVKRLAKSRN